MFLPEQALMDRQKSLCKMYIAEKKWYIALLLMPGCENHFTEFHYWLRDCLRGHLFKM